MDMLNRYPSRPSCQDRACTTRSRGCRAQGDLAGPEATRGPRKSPRLAATLSMARVAGDPGCATNICPPPIPCRRLLPRQCCPLALRDPLAEGPSGPAPCAGDAVVCPAVRHGATPVPVEPHTSFPRSVGDGGGRGPLVSARRRRLYCRPS